jgi:CheY-like chemotaxis protein
MSISTHEQHPRARILVVDDDRPLRVFLALMFEREGHSPVAVPSVARALERFNDAGADLILTDLTMPVLGGLDLLQILETRGNAVPVIAMTGSDDETIAARALAFGAVEVIRKPFSSERLARAVRAALGAAGVLEGNAAA